MTATDVLVVGGGIAGVSTAYHLAVLGHDAVLLERGEVASEASGVNAGSITVMGWGTMPDLSSYLTTGSLEIFKHLALDLGHDIELRVSGALQAIQTGEQYDWSRDRVLRLRGQGYALELLTARDARAIDPAVNPHVPGYVFYPRSAQADPVKATRAFAAEAERRGTRILTGRSVSAIREAGSAWIAETPHGEVRANALVIAAGAWCRPIGAMLGLDIPIVPVRGQMWATAPLSPRLFVKIASAESAMQWAEKPGNDETTPPELTHLGDTRVTRHLYGRQRQDGAIIFGGDRQLVGFDKTVAPPGIESNHRHASEVVPFLRDVPIVRTWAGLMPFSLDGKPLIGALPGRERLYIVSGLASSGFGRGPMAGQLLAELIHTGHRPHVLAESDPTRCVRRLGAAPA